MNSGTAKSVMIAIREKTIAAYVAAASANGERMAKLVAETILERVESGLSCYIKVAMLNRRDAIEIINILRAAGYYAVYLQNASSWDYVAKDDLIPATSGLGWKDGGFYAAPFKVEHLQ
jgi:hypothetical protein